MSTEFTLAIVKPDAVASGKTGLVLAHLQKEGFVVRAARLVRLSKAEAAAFYTVPRLGQCRERPAGSGVLLHRSGVGRSLGVTGDP